jgi:hypothetical protein
MLEGLQAREDYADNFVPYPSPHLWCDPRNARRTMAVIAEQLGYADTRMTEMHHAHLAPPYVASTIPANFPALGLVQPTAIVSLRPKGGAA